jgi:flavin reductase (DIM6/NTAB) family NADH-FMN oxidoreductase RutF
MDNQDYIEIPKEQAYILMTPGPVVLVSTVNCDGRADIAPVNP